MIKVFFPPGCYGTYVARCIYNYTDLRNQPFVDFVFDASGSSHQHYDNAHTESVVQTGHINTLDCVDSDRLVVISPCLDHRLDYFNNQFAKQAKQQLVEWIKRQLTEDEAVYKLQTYWGYSKKFDNNVPNWIMREWCSFWIQDALTNTYNLAEYEKLKSTAQCSTQDIFENWLNTCSDIVTALDLTFTVDNNQIKKQHEAFLKAQKLHDSQIRCCQYVDDAIKGIDTEMTLHTIFDEAYIQHLLRQQSFEIQCNGLDIFPTTTLQLNTLIYETSNNTNT